MKERGKRVLPIVFAADANFSVPFGLAVYSLLESAKLETFYDIYVLDDGITEEIKRDVEKLKYRFNFSITYFNVSEEVKGMPSSTVFPPVAYARFILPDLLPKHITERVFYIDSDVIFLDDLTPLYDMDMEGKPVAATQGLNMTATDNRKYLLRLGEEFGVNFYEPGAPYFHSGELLFDLRLWKEGEYSHKCFELSEGEISKKVLFFDQDFFNLACRGQIANFPARYCVIPLFERRYYGDYERMYEGLSLYSEEELLDALKNPAIIHYAGYKPIIFEKPKYVGEEAFFNVWKRSPWSRRIPYFPRSVLSMTPHQKRLELLKCDNEQNLQQTVSIIIHTHNLVDNLKAGAFIQNVDSLHGQDYPYLEIIAVDSESDDGTNDLLRKYQEKGILRCVSTVHKNRFAAYNEALEYARGSYVLFMKSDDLISEKTGIATMVSCIKGENADYVCGVSELYGRDGKIISAVSPSCHPFRLSAPGRLSSTLFLTSVVRSVGCFDVEKHPVCADYSLFLTLAQDRFKVAESGVRLREHHVDEPDSQHLLNCMLQFIGKVPEKLGYGENPEISVIVAMCGNLEYFQATLAALLVQQFQDVEFIFVDDLQNESATRLVTSACEHDARIVYIPNASEQGMCMSRNCGLNVARGRYIAFVQSGDIPDSTWLKQLYRRAYAGGFSVVMGQTYQLSVDSFSGVPHSMQSDLVAQITGHKSLLGSFSHSVESCLFSAVELQKNNIRFADLPFSTDETLFILQVASHTPTWRFSFDSSAACLIGLGGNNYSKTCCETLLEQEQTIQRKSFEYLLKLPSSPEVSLAIADLFEDALTHKIAALYRRGAGRQHVFEYLSHIAILLENWKASGSSYMPGIAAQIYQSMDFQPAEYEARGEQSLASFVQEERNKQMSCVTTQLSSKLELLEIALKQKESVIVAQGTMIKQFESKLKQNESTFTALGEMIKQFESKLKQNESTFTALGEMIKQMEINLKYKDSLLATQGDRLDEITILLQKNNDRSTRLESACVQQEAKRQKRKSRVRYYLSFGVSRQKNKLIFNKLKQKCRDARFAVREICKSVLGEL